MFPTSIREFTLYDSGKGYAFYFHPVGMGFAHAILVERVGWEDKPDAHLCRVKHLSGNSWGQTPKGEPRTTDKPHTLTYIITRTDYYPTIKRAIDALTGKTEVPKGKRKPRPIAAMTLAELRAFAQKHGLELRD